MPGNTSITGLPVREMPGSPLTGRPVIGVFPGAGTCALQEWFKFMYLNVEIAEKKYTEELLQVLSSGS